MYFLKSPIEGPKAFENFKNLVENQFNCKIKRFHCDNSKAEYNNLGFKSLLAKDSILYKPLAFYTQSQNSVSEYIICTINSKI